MEDTAQEKRSINLTTKEMWFLMNQFPSINVIGIENPYIGWDFKEILEGNRTVVRSLEINEFAHVLSDNSLEVDDVLMEMVHTCAVPDHTLLVQTQSDQGKELQRYIHFREHWIVENLHESLDVHQITSFKDCECLSDHLKYDLRSSSQSSSRGKPFFLAEDILFTASQCYANGKDDEGFATLKAGKLDEDLLDRLAATMADPVANTSFTFILNMQDADTQYVGGFGLLEGKSEFWILIPGERSGLPVVEFIPANAGLVHQRFMDMLPV